MKKTRTTLERSRAWYRREIEGYQRLLATERANVADYYEAYCWIKDTAGQGVHPDALSTWERVCQ